MQRDRESLREYITIFSIKSFEIADLVMIDIVNTLIKDLKPKKKPPKDIIDLFN